MNPTEPCCEVFPQIAHHFGWMSPEDEPETACLAHIKGKDGRDYHLNYCPSCGKEIRGVVMNVNDTVSEEQVKLMHVLQKAEEAIERTREQEPVMSRFLLTP
jgi:hypothetical protein